LTIKVSKKQKEKQTLWKMERKLKEADKRETRPQALSMSLRKGSARAGDEWGRSQIGLKEEELPFQYEMRIRVPKINFNSVSRGLENGIGEYRVKKKRSKNEKNVRATQLRMKSR